MKYSEKNKPIVCMLTQSDCYRKTKKMKIKGVLWHSTGADNPTLKRYVQPDDNAPDRDAMMILIGKNTNENDWNHTSVEAGLNAWIGKMSDGSVAAVQTMPWDFKPWGCGKGTKGSCNDGWIQFEICEDSLKDKSYFDKVYREACELTAYLCKTYGIDPRGYAILNRVKVPMILCHADSHALGLGSNHGDVLHWFSRFGKTMDNVRDDVAALVSGSTMPEQNTASVVSFTPYSVRVNIPDLNIRTGPGLSYSRTGQFTGSGVFIIVEEKNGWGRLKSGAGWIKLSFTEKI